jgi:hypothetical protein
MNQVSTLQHVKVLGNLEKFKRAEAKRQNWTSDLFFMYGQTYFTVLFSFPFQQGMEIPKMHLNHVQTQETKKIGKKEENLVDSR